jgi:pimeloyl-ACP methyl ester carboxylesterase
MPVYTRGDVHIYYEEQGEGFPVLLIAPGGMRSAIPFWENAPWNPIEQLRNHFRVIAMDQRNAGRSKAPVRPDDGWVSYTEDQLGLMDHLGIERFHTAGMCIGGPYCMGLVQAAPDRVASAVLFQPIGLVDNRQAFFDMFDNWAEALRPEHPEVPEVAWESFRDAMYGGEFLFNVSREFVRDCPTPLLVLCGSDLYHPRETSLEIVDLAPRGELIEHWKEPEHREAARARVLAFLLEHTPGSG